MYKLKKVTVLIIFGLMLAMTSNTYAQEGGSNGGGGADIILFDLVNTALHIDASTMLDMTRTDSTTEGR